MAFDSVAYKNVVSNGLVLDKNGQKMSKRLGNAVDPFTTLDEFGPDATRWYMITNAQPWLCVCDHIPARCIRSEFIKCCEWIHGIS